MRGIGVFAALVVVLATPAAAHAQSPWDPVSGTLPATHAGAPAEIKPDAYRAFTLDAGGPERPAVHGARGRACAAGRRSGPRTPSSRCPRRTAAPALRGQGVADHGARPRGRAPGDQDLRGRRPRRPDARRSRADTDAARLPRLGALADTAPGTSTPTTTSTTSVYVSYYGARPDRRPARRVRRERERRRRRRPARTSAPRPTRPPADGPAAHLPPRARHRPDATRPTSAARPTSPRPRSR